MTVGLCTADYHTLSTGKTNSHSLPLSCPFTEFLFDRFSYKVTMGDHVEDLAEIKVYNTYCFPLVHRATHLNREGNQVGEV